MSSPRLWLALVVALGIAATPFGAARADALTPVSAVATSQTGSQQAPDRLIDGSGLDGTGPVEFRSHDRNGAGDTMWAAGSSDGGLGGPSGSPPTVADQAVVFDLGAVHALDGAFVWGYNRQGFTERGADEIEVLVSSGSDPSAAASFTPVGTFRLFEACGCSDEGAQRLPFAATARLVKFAFVSAHSGATDEFVGLSEVRFSEAASFAVSSHLVKPRSVVSSTAASDLHPAANLLRLSVDLDGFASATDPIVGSDSGWLTDEPNGPAGDYFAPPPPGAPPQLTFDLGIEHWLSGFVFWGHSSAAGDEASAFTVEVSHDGGASWALVGSFGNPDFAAGTPRVFDFPAPARADTVRVTVDDNHAGDGLGPGGSRVGFAELRFLRTPLERGSFAGAGSAFDATGSGATVYAGFGIETPASGSFESLDLSAPGAPLLLDSAVVPAPVRAVALAGDTAYAATEATLFVYDVSDPSTLVARGSFAASDAFSDVAVSGTTLALADGTAGLILVDASDPDLPLPLGSWDSPGEASGVVLAGTTAHLADGSAGLQIVDVATPAAPALLGAYDTPGDAGDVDVVGPLAFVADGASGLLVLDVSDPAAPTLLASHPTSASASGVRVRGPIAVVALENDGLLVLDVRDPASPRELGRLDTPGSARRVALIGPLALVSDGTGGLRIVDVSALRLPVELSAVATADQTLAAAIGGSNAFVADDSVGLRALDVADPIAPAVLGSVDTPDSANGVAVAGGHAFVADDMSGIRVVDVSDPTSPTEVGSFDTGNQATGIAVSGSIAFVADRFDGLRVLDVSDPSLPVEIGSLLTPNQARDVAVSGDRVYVADGFSGLRVVDVSDPTAPTELGFVDTPDFAVGVAVSGTTVFVADVSTGLRIIDASVPTAPVEIASIATQDFALDVAVSGALALVADGFEGLRLVDVSDPAAPVELGVVDTPGEATEAAVSSRLAVVADSDEGTRIVPEPHGGALGALGGALLAGLARRRARSRPGPR